MQQSVLATVMWYGCNMHSTCLDNRTPDSLPLCKKLTALRPAATEVVLRKIDMEEVLKIGGAARRSYGGSIQKLAALRAAATEVVLKKTSALHVAATEVL